MWPHWCGKKWFCKCLLKSIYPLHSDSSKEKWYCKCLLKSICPPRGILRILLTMSSPQTTREGILLALIFLGLSLRLLKSGTQTSSKTFTLSLVSITHLILPAMKMLIFHHRFPYYIIICDPEVAPSETFVSDLFWSISISHHASQRADAKWG